jgi:hypothetical protein
VLAQKWIEQLPHNTKRKVGFKLAPACARHYETALLSQ